MENNLRTTRRCIRLMMAGLIISGLTALPLAGELDFLTRIFPTGSMLGNWLDQVYSGIHYMENNYRFLFYGYDWLAFAHILFAILFIGPLKNPVQNKWVLEFGVIASLLIIPFALVAGEVRSIPFWWRLIDCSFGLIGIFLMATALSSINAIEDAETVQELYPEFKNN